MQLRVLNIIIYFIILGFCTDDSPKLSYIPSRTIQPYKLGGVNDEVKLAMGEFEISNFITYAQYKIYLKQIKTDSSNGFYQSQLPDTAMCNNDIARKYITCNEYDNYPVLGVRWDAALNYCRWLTLKQGKDSINYIYCLPTYSQWIDAYDYLTKNSAVNDLNKDYSDWLLSSKDETWYDNKWTNRDSTYVLDDTYMADKAEPMVMKRKFVIGNSYLFKWDKLLNYYYNSYYSDHGYRQIGFRYVKYKIGSQGVSTRYNAGHAEKVILKYWGLNQKTK